ncbi:hypothetical protein CR513_29499, partial [Mucuna pruriens]
MDEMASIERNNNWELTKLPKGHKTIGVKWIYKTKLKQNGEVDVKSAFLHGALEEQVFVDHPLAYVKVEQEGKGTTKYGIFYMKGEKSYLLGFTDSDYFRKAQ